MFGIREQLHAKVYKPQPIQRVMIPKSGGGQRPLGIPTIPDRVIQTAAKLVLEPIFEADLEPNAYGYRTPNLQACKDLSVKPHSFYGQVQLFLDIKAGKGYFSTDWSVINFFSIHSYYNILYFI